MTTNALEPVFIETKQYQRFKEFCDACRQYKYIGLCYGVPGVGKTLSARRYANWHAVSRYTRHAPDCGVTTQQGRGSSVVLYTVPVIANAVTVRNDIRELRSKLRDFLLDEIRDEEAPHLQAAQRQIDALHKPYYERGACGFDGPPELLAQSRDAWREAHDRMAARMDAVPDPTTLIVINEADRLKMTGLEQVRDTFDCGGIGVVLIGMPGLEKRLARYPQLYSRIGFVHEFKPLSNSEVRQLLRDRWSPADLSLSEEGWIDDDIIATLVRVAHGKFRLLDRLLAQIARVLEINGLDKITIDVVEAARENLVIGTA